MRQGEAVKGISARPVWQPRQRNASSDFARKSVERLQGLFWQTWL